MSCWLPTSGRINNRRKSYGPLCILASVNSGKSGRSVVSCSKP
jgi:hypothetical protein